MEIMSGNFKKIQDLILFKFNQEIQYSELKVHKCLLDVSKSERRIGQNLNENFLIGTQPLTF